HPILELIRARVAAGTRPSRHGDGARLGLAVEGGGMRGCVSAGMVTALHRLGAADAFDAVYGSSAGCLVGAYFISRQTNGTAVYHDVLPEAGARFLDKSRLVAALGATTSMRPRAWAGLRPRLPHDVFNLDFLMTTVVGRLWPLDWTSFWANNRHQPLNVVVSGLLSMDSHTLTSAKGHFATLPELARCMRASMLVPGMTGPLVTFPGHQPFADALIFEPMPYRSAAADGCTHVVVLRTRPDGSQVGAFARSCYE
ncbi:acyl transferase/acyl hydrolase/lysophospholipase, partial [Tribonema minus]